MVKATLTNMSLLTFLATILVSLVALTTAQSCSVLQEVNGCTIPFGLDIPFKNTFEPACLNHDVCYRCVSRALRLLCYLYRSFYAGLYQSYFSRNKDRRKGPALKQIWVKKEN